MGVSSEEEVSIGCVLLGESKHHVLSVEKHVELLRKEHGLGQFNGRECSPT